MELEQTIFHLIDKADLFSAKNTMLRWIDENPDRESVETAILLMLEEVGRRYIGKEDVSLAQAYVASEVAAAAIERAATIAQDANKKELKKGPVVLANIEDDFHSLGRRMLVTVLEANHWLVVDMGNDVPAKAVVDKAVEVNARVIGISAMMYTTALNIKSVREELDRRNLSGSIKLAVGGAVFNQRPGLIDEVGGDGTCRTAFGVPQLMTALWEQACGEGWMI